jgi:hypothetical protein
MSKATRVSRSFALVCVLSTSVLAAPRDDRPRHPGEPPIVRKIVRVLKWIAKATDEALTIPKP